MVRMLDMRLKLFIKAMQAVARQTARMIVSQHYTGEPELSRRVQACGMTGVHQM